VRQLTSVEFQLYRAAELLGPLRERFVFVGGAIRGLLVTDPAAQGVRPTDDIDTIVEVGSLSAYHEVERELQRHGFKHDLREEAPICRFVSGMVTLDVMPLAAAILGFSNPWYPHAFRTALTHVLPGEGDHPLAIRVISAPSFLATKLVSYTDRGGRDPFHRDLEDIIALVDGRESLLDEVADESHELIDFIAGAITKLLGEGLASNIAYHLPPDDASQARLPLVLTRLRAMALGMK
jgi:hypothetical protein